jgi:predicted ATPase/DNA-binding CsgD family transcriptional regulator
VWFIELSAAAEPAHVPEEVMSALGVQQDPGKPPLEVLAEALAPRQLLLILDNCEHVLSAVAELCGILLGRADDVRVLATSRAGIRIGGEAQYRLSPLDLPDSDDPEAVGRSPAAALFIERAGQADPRFVFGPEHAPLVARVVAQLDGMPLPIELAAARVEALGMAGLAERIDDAMRLLTGKDLLAADRHRSLAAVADWSYQLLAEPERRVFRRLAVFPGPFTLDAAEGVAGPEAGPIVLRLVDCSLVAPPRQGADERTRYSMLQTMRAFAVIRLREAGEEPEATAALAAFGWSVAEQATAGLERGQTELSALCWLDAEDATLSRALGWALEHDPEHALRLATALAPWLRQRARLAEAHHWLSAAAARSSPSGETWARAHLWLGHLQAYGADSAVAAGHHTAVVEAYRGLEPSRTLVEAVAVRAVLWVDLGDIPKAVHDARRALALAHELSDAGAQLVALTAGAMSAYCTGDAAAALGYAREAQDLLPADMPGYLARCGHGNVAVALTEAGDLDSARRLCEAGLSLSRQVGDWAELLLQLRVMARIERQAGNLADAVAFLREAVDVASRMSTQFSLADLVAEGGYLCAATGRWADAVTLWAAYTAHRSRLRQPAWIHNDGGHTDYMRRIEQALEPDRLREAQERGARMALPAAAELAVIVTAQQEPAQPAARTPLSPREQELITLVAHGHTNAEIAARLYISVRTVASHLDRIRDKTGYRRRADLTRLAIAESLV